MFDAVDGGLWLATVAVERGHEAELGAEERGAAVEGTAEVER